MSDKTLFEIFVDQLEPILLENPIIDLGLGTEIHINYKTISYFMKSMPREAFSIALYPYLTHNGEVVVPADITATNFTIAWDSTTKDVLEMAQNAALMKFILEKDTLPIEKNRLEDFDIMYPLLKGYVSAVHPDHLCMLPPMLTARILGFMEPNLNEEVSQDNFKLWQDVTTTVYEDTDCIILRRMWYNPTGFHIFMERCGWTWKNRSYLVLQKMENNTLVRTDSDIFMERHRLATNLGQ